MEAQSLTYATYDIEKEGGRFIQSKAMNEVDAGRDGERAEENGCFSTIHLPTPKLSCQGARGAKCINRKNERPFDQEVTMRGGQLTANWT